MLLRVQVLESRPAEQDRVMGSLRVGSRDEADRIAAMIRPPYRALVQVCCNESAGRLVWVDLDVLMEVAHEL